MKFPPTPTTEAQAIAWVYWAESEIGVGFHPDTKGAEYVTSDGKGPMMATCSKCGETFVPCDEDDTIHIMTESWVECGGPAVEATVGRWGSLVRLFTDEEAVRYDEALSAAHAILDDIYEVSLDLAIWLNPDLFDITTTEGHTA